MGKINTVEYEVIEENFNFNKKYWYDNVTLLTSKFDDEYIEYFKKEKDIKFDHIRNIRDRLLEDKEYNAIFLKTLIYGTSSFSNKNILIAEII